MAEAEEKPPIQVFLCPGGCPSYNDHVWDGPTKTWTDPNGSVTETSTCSKCGRTAIDVDMWEGP